MKCDTGGTGATTRVQLMEERQDQDEAIVEYHRAEGVIGEQLMQEINLLILEGAVFCFDPKQHKKRPHKRVTTTAEGETITVEINPVIGQPSQLAYRVLQECLRKLAKQKYPYTGKVPFTWRGLANDLDHRWGGRTQKKIEQALDQLQSTRITCKIVDKKKNGEFVKFHIVPKYYATMREGRYVHGLLEFDGVIVNSLNGRHVAYFNLDRLRELDVLGQVMYKRLFFHFSNIWNPTSGKHRSQIYFHKDYEAICNDWLGGLTVRQHKSLIWRDQLGCHIEGLIATGLVRVPDSGDPKDIIQRKEKGGGFKLEFPPGPGFFEDYDAYYVRRERPVRTTADELMDEVTEPILVVGHFHELLGHDHQAHDETLEFACATKLINELGLPAVHALTKYTVDAIREAGYDTRKTRLFNLVNDYRPRWEKDRNRRRELEKRQADIAACPDCNNKGMVSMRNHTGATTAVPCPHDGELLMAYEERENLRRMPN